MIQVIGLRPYTDEKTGKEKKRHQLFCEGTDVPNLFKNIDKVLDQIPKSEHWNLYYTALDCKDPKDGLRRFESQKIIPFDIDGIDTTTKLRTQYIKIVLATLGVTYEKTGIVFTGNGLQFIIEIDIPFKDPQLFDKKRTHYKSICHSINRAFNEKGLPGNADPAVWSAARLLRLPNTENRKPKGNTKAFLVQGTIKPQPFTLEGASGIPELNEEHHLSDWNPKNQPTVDHKEIYKTCEFIKWTQIAPGEISEPQYYAALSVLARMENGDQRAHGLAEAIRESGTGSETVSGYDHSEIENKIEQALKVSGPRTCPGIDALWGKCKTCVHWQKISSPIQIKGKDFIATAKTGFHKPVKLANGHTKMMPDFRDLLRYFDSKFHHKTNEGGGVYIYKEKHYQNFERGRIKQFALEHFNPEGKTLPYANDHTRREFLSLVETTSIVKSDFFIERGKLNFRSGVLDIRTMEITDHSPERGFQYVLDYDFDPSAKCPAFDKFFDQITCEDKELQDTLLEYMGYALSGDKCWAQKCLLLVGEGANGKSTFINLLAELAGKANLSALPLKSMDKPTSISLLEDKLFNISEEIPQGKYIESSEIKNLITGGQVEARRLYKDPFFMENKAKLIFACNELPESKDVTGGYFRRFIIIPFNATFEETYDPSNKRYIANRQIVDELKVERSGIMNRVVAAYAQLVKRQRFSQAKAHVEAMSEYKLENDPVMFWALDSGRLEIKDYNGGVTFPTLKELYSSYKMCMEFEAQQRPLSIKKFTRRLRKIIPMGNLRIAVKKIQGKTHKVMLDLIIHETE